MVLPLKRTCRFSIPCTRYIPSKLVRAGLRLQYVNNLKILRRLKTCKKLLNCYSGLSYNDSAIENSKNNWLASVFINKKTTGLSLLDLSTGEFLAAQGEIGKIDKLLNNFQPKGTYTKESA